MFGWEMLNRDAGVGGNPLLFYDEATGFFLISGETFAFSRDHTNFPAHQEAVFFRDYEM